MILARLPKGSRKKRLFLLVDCPLKGRGEGVRAPLKKEELFIFVYFFGVGIALPKNFLGHAPLPPPSVYANCAFLTVSREILPFLTVFREILPFLTVFREILP